MVKPGCLVIDVGVNVVVRPNNTSSEAGSGNVRHLVGDVDFEHVARKAGYITPVPGGVGPLTVAMLLRNVLRAAKRIQKVEETEDMIT